MEGGRTAHGGGRTTRRGGLERGPRDATTTGAAGRTTGEEAGLHLSSTGTAGAPGAMTPAEPEGTREAEGAPAAAAAA